MTDPPRPLRIAIVNDYEIVVAGLAASLVPYPDRVDVVELDSRVPVVSDVDLILYDTFGQVQGDGVDLGHLVHGTRARVVIYSWNTQPELIDRALTAGAAGYLSKQLGAVELLDQLERAAHGQVVRPPRAQEDRPDEDRPEHGVWPGREHGLTAREAEVIALISQGLTNQQIAETTYLSINSVKTYIRTAYRKLDITRRSQAVIWGLNHGFEPDRVRLVRSRTGRAGSISQPS